MGDDLRKRVAVQEKTITGSHFAAFSCHIGLILKTFLRPKAEHGTSVSYAQLVYDFLWPPSPAISDDLLNGLRGTVE